jgi:cytoskeletal protein CcmA (bactofilin family)
MISKDQKTASPEIENKMSVDQIESSGTVIANDTRFKGTIGIVWIAKKGKIYANVYARKVIVEGEINGNIASAEYVELKSEGRLIGNLKAAKIRLAPGCYFDGEVSMR